VDLPIYRQISPDLDLELDEMQPDELPSVRDMLNDVVLEGSSYPQSVPLSAEEFARYWLPGDAFVVRRHRASTSISSPSPAVVGAFYLKPNFPGRCGHIGNAGFIVAPAVRGQGIGRLMGETMLALARDRGYRAIMYNLVFETNVPSFQLWASLCFREIGRIPQAVQLPDGRYVDALMLYRSLD
jgi:L-amino acid N-acyltransferase YncA